MVVTVSSDYSIELFYDDFLVSIYQNGRHRELDDNDFDGDDELTIQFEVSEMIIVKTLVRYSTGEQTIKLTLEEWDGT